MTGERVERWFGGLAFPVWVIVDSEAAKEYPSFAVHILEGDGGDVHLPLFESEEKARHYIANLPLVGHETAPVSNSEDLRITLEVFRNRGGTHVRINDPDGQTEGLFCPELDEFITRLPPREAGEP